MEEPKLCLIFLTELKTRKNYDIMISLSNFIDRHFFSKANWLIKFVYVKIFFLYFNIWRKKLLSIKVLINQIIYLFTNIYNNGIIMFSSLQNLSLKIKKFSISETNLSFEFSNVILTSLDLISNMFLFCFSTHNFYYYLI